MAVHHILDFNSTKDGKNLLSKLCCRPICPMALKLHPRIIDPNYFGVNLLNLLK